MLNVFYRLHFYFILLYFKVVPHSLVNNNDIHSEQQRCGDAVVMCDWRRWPCS